MELQKSKKRLKTGKTLKIVALGDSLTQGWMVQKCYLDFLKEMLREKYPGSNFTIINSGVPGDTAEGGLYRLRRDVLELNPDLVFIQFALNDAFFWVSSDRFKNSIKSIIEKIKSDTSSEILLLTSIPINQEGLNQLAEEFYNKLISISENEKIPIALVHRYWNKKISEGINFNNLVQFDQVHPNIEGHRLMAEAIMEVL